MLFRSATLMEKRPSMSVMVPLVVPFSAMLAPISGSPAEVTTPEMVFDWANTELLQATKSNKKTRKRFVLFLVCLLVRISFSMIRLCVIIIFVFALLFYFSCD